MIGQFESCPVVGAHHGRMVDFRSHVIRNKTFLWVRVEAVFCDKRSSGVQDGEPQRSCRNLGRFRL